MMHVYNCGEMRGRCILFENYNSVAALHYITLHYKLFIVAKVKNCKVHYGASHTTIYDCRNVCLQFSMLQ